jgi:hypothetical protein
MTSTNWDVAQDIGFNIQRKAFFYFATADGKESASAPGNDVEFDLLA